MSAETLLEISRIDSLMSIVLDEHKKGEQKIVTIKKELVTLQSDIEKKKTLIKELKHKQSFGEANLKAEELKVVERRRMIMQMGPKAGKHLEREYELSKRQIETLEEDLLNLITLVEDEDKKFKDLNSRFIDLTLSSETDLPELVEKVADKNLEYTNLKTRAEQKLESLDDKVKTMYLRVKTKYPRDPVGFSKGGVCSACSRSLPPQIARTEPVNCPGCGRILVLKKD